MNPIAMPVWDPQLRRASAVATGLWLFMAVASTLFALFITAYAMRMIASDWSPIAMPPQLWLSTALLLAGSLLLHGAARAAHSRRLVAGRRLLMAGGLAAMAFLGCQLWAWQHLLDARVELAGNPAASFFYVLTALHGLHVIGGLVAWSVTAQAAAPPSTDPSRLALHVRLCARYWHFLLALWCVLFATLAWLTPERVRYICGLD